MVLAATFLAALEHEELILQGDVLSPAALAEWSSLSTEAVTKQAPQALQPVRGDNGTEGTFRAESDYLCVEPSTFYAQPLPRPVSDLRAHFRSPNPGCCHGSGAGIVGIIVLNL